MYSNSLDQAWEPRLALKTWLSQFKVGGLVIIEHTNAHGPSGAVEMDPFGVRPVAMPCVLSEWFGHQVSISHSKDGKSNYGNDAWLFVLKKIVEQVE